MRFIVTVLTLFVSCHTFAQVEWSGRIQWSTGYEHNLFNSPPVFASGDSIYLEGPDLIRQSPFYELRTAISLKRDFKKHRIRWYGNANGMLFQGNSNANTLNAFTRFKHEWRLSKKYRLTTNYRLKRYIRQAVDEAAEPFQQLNSYWQLEVQPEFRIRTNRQTYWYVGTGFRQRFYDQIGNEQTRYIQYQVYSRLRKELFPEREQSHELELEVFTRYRKYRQQRFSQTDGAVASTTYRLFGYFGIRVMYGLPFGKFLTLEPGLTYTFRKNFNGGNFSYSELRPEIGLEFEKKKWSFSLAGSYTHRLYPDQAVEDDGRLVYQYWRTRLTTTYALSKRWAVFFSGALTTRNSTNEDETSRAFRSYDNYWVKLGVRWTF